VIVRETALAGVFIVDPQSVRDERGLFARTFCAREFAERGLDPRVVQCSTSFNARRGTLRGMHYQAAPNGETKLVRCTAGAIFDVAVDLRPGSATHRRWVATELSASSRRALYVPEGVAHGFMTLEDASEVLYQMSAFHEPGAARGVRWDDPAFAIAWPSEPVAVSARDRAFPDYQAAHVAAIEP